MSFSKSFSWYYRETVFTILLDRKDRKSASVIHVNRKLWDINPFRSRCFFSLAFIVTHHHGLYRCFNGFFECILLFWKSRFHLRQRGWDENLFLSTSMFVTIFENMVLLANRWPLKVGSPIEGECVGHKLKELKTENWNFLTSMHTRLKQYYHFIGLFNLP